MSEVALNPENLERLEKLGYDIPRYFNEDKKKFVYKKGTKILVKVEDLTKSSPSLVDVQCQYCFKIKTIKYRDYTKSTESSEIKKYCCRECSLLKKKELNDLRQSQGKLSRGDKAYWTYKENRLKELDLYLKKHGTIHNMQKDRLGCVISSSINQYGNDSTEDCCVELGYDLESVKIKYKPEGYYDKLENIIFEIEKIIKDIGRFPKQIEVLKTLHINNNYLLRYGGIREIKKIMGYDSSDDLIDDRGYSNRSVYEYMTAQYLIANNIPYERDVYPFKGKDSRLRSDFTFYLENGEIIHVEVWGFSKNDNQSSRAKTYNKKRIKKEKLYENYNYKLIGIEYELFRGKYDEVQSRLFEVFSPYLSLKYKFIQQKLIIPPTKLSDEELLTEILKYKSDSDSMLPESRILQENGVSGLYLEAVKRYGSYFDFAQKFGMYTHYQINKWDKDKIFECFEYMINTYGHVLMKDEVKANVQDRKLTGIIESSKKFFGGLVEARFSFYEHCIVSNTPISSNDIMYLDNLIHSRKGFNFWASTEERIERAKYIISNAIEREAI
jgi:hypothetical protein